MQLSSRITTKGQVTVPKKIRDELKIKSGDVIQFVRKGGDVVIKPVKTLLDLKGVIKTDRKLEDWDSARDHAKKYVVKKVLESLK